MPQKWRKRRAAIFVDKRNDVCYSIATINVATINILTIDIVMTVVALSIVD